MQYQYSEQHREGDHICYYSDLRKMRSHFPDWDITISLQECLQQMVAAWQARD
jgi:CDP-paratose 2-epimerase